MAEAARQDKHVKNGVVEGNPFNAIENCPHRVRYAAGGEPDEPVSWKAMKKRFDSENNDPAHQDVHDGGEDVVATGKEDFQNDPGDGQTPDRSKDQPAGGTGEGKQREGRIGAGDQQINGGMVDHPETASPSRFLCAVVDGGSGV